MADLSGKDADKTVKRRHRNPPLPPVKPSSLFIAMACSGKGTPIQSDKCPPNTFPVLAGAALTSGRQPGLSYDDFGQNISKEYPLYGLLTVTYWLHKNAPDFDFVGICDECRRLLITENHRHGFARKKIDVVLPSQRIKLSDIEAYFHPDAQGSLRREDYERLMGVLDEKYPDMAACVRDLFSHEFVLPSNVLVARSDIFHAYAEFLFAVLQTLQQENASVGIQQEPGSLCMLGRLLTTLYFEYHKEDYKIKRVNCHTIVTNHHKPRKME